MLTDVVSRKSKLRIPDDYCSRSPQCRDCLLVTTEYCQAGDRRGHAIDAAYSVFLEKVVKKSIKSKEQRI